MSLGPTITTSRIKVFNLYSAPAFVIGASGSSGSQLITTNSYTVKTVCAYIYPYINSSGSLTISGSFDGVNVLQFTGSQIVYSGSNKIITFNDAISSVAVYLSNLVTGSSVSGSLYLSAIQ